MRHVHHTHTAPQGPLQPEAAVATLSLTCQPTDYFALLIKKDSFLNPPHDFFFNPFMMRDDIAAFCVCS